MPPPIINNNNNNNYSNNNGNSSGRVGGDSNAYHFNTTDATTAVTRPVSNRQSESGKSKSPRKKKVRIDNNTTTAAADRKSHENDNSTVSSYNMGSATSRQRKHEDGPIAVRPNYSISSLVNTLGSSLAIANTESNMTPELERRVRDFRLAQEKRRARYGEQKHWGIFGMYAHLASVRTDLEWAEDAAWRRDNGKPYLSWNDFEEAHKGAQKMPYFTYGFIAVCTLMMLVEYGINGWTVEPLKVNPLIGPSAESLRTAGARDTTLIVEGGQWFRIFSPVILHAGMIHFLINMLAMWFIGAAVEQNHGVFNTIILFFVPGFGGNILSAIFLPQYISVGASGGIFGLIGACLADIILNWRLLFVRASEGDNNKHWRRNAILWLVLDIFVNVLLGLTPYIDNFTHLGGLLYGLAFGLSTLDALPVGFFGVESSTVDKVKQLIMRYLGLLISAIFILASTIWLATSEVGSNPCPGCRYISCVPFPLWSNDPWWSCDDCDFVTADLFQSGSGQPYSRIILTCPDKAIEDIDISGDKLFERDDVRRKLPSYCRDYCENVFRDG